MPFGGTFRGKGAFRELIPLVASTIPLGKLEFLETTVGDEFAVELVDFTSRRSRGPLRVAEVIRFRGEQICEIYARSTSIPAPWIAAGERKKAATRIERAERTRPWLPTSTPPCSAKPLGTTRPGVAVVTAIADDGNPAGMVVGTFSSVSLDPPLVAFFPITNSRSFALLRTARAFCINVLASDQELLCRQFATAGASKFDGVGWRPGPLGSPILDGVVSWIECTFDDIREAGDHFIVLGLRARPRGASAPPFRCCSSRAATGASHRARSSRRPIPN